MRNKFVADGHQRFLLGKKAMASEPIEKKHARELAQAGPVGKIQIQERILAEHAQRAKIENHQPSAGTLY